MTSYHTQAQWFLYAYHIYILYSVEAACGLTLYKKVWTGRELVFCVCSYMVLPARIHQLVFQTTHNLIGVTFHPHRIAAVISLSRAVLALFLYYQSLITPCSYELVPKPCLANILKDIFTHIFISMRRTLSKSLKQAGIDIPI